MPSLRLPVLGWRKVWGPGPVTRQGPRSGSRNRRPTRSAPSKVEEGIFEKSGVFEGEEGIRKVGEGLANARETSGGEEDVKTTVVVKRGGEVETPSAVAGPGRAGEGRVESDDKLAGRVDGVGGEVKGHTVETMVGREGRVRDRARIWLRVSSACGSKSCQRLGGKVMWAEEKTAMTWFLAVRIARSAGLERWLKGGT